MAELEAIVIRAAGILGVTLDPAGGSEVARRARGTPRIANRLLRRVRDYAEVRADGVVSQAVARDALALFEVEESGLDKVDRAILGAICRRFGGGRWDCPPWPICVGEEPETVRDAYQPFLLQLGLLQRTPCRGRGGCGLATPGAGAAGAARCPDEHRPGGSLSMSS